MRRISFGPSVRTFFWIFLACLLVSPPKGWVEAAVGAVTAVPMPVSQTMVDLANADRTRLGRSTLHANDSLMRAAQLHADQMARVGELQHVLTNAAFPRPEDRLAEAIYRWRTYGENIAMGQSTPVKVQESWMASTKHRDNILNAAFTELGTGFATDAQGLPYYVQVFGTPRQ